MCPEEPPTEPSDGIEAWEWKLLKEVLRQVRSRDPDYLETQLLIKLIALKKEKKRARSWENFLWTSLHNHALNVVRNLNRLKMDSVDAVEGFQRHVDPSFPSSYSVDRQLAIKAAQQEFSPRLRRLWEALQKCEGSQQAAAKRLRKHPNTISKQVAQIRRILKRHGLP